MADSATLFRTVVRGNADNAESEEDRGLPSLGEGEYQPYGRPANKPLYALHFINPKGHITSFQYQHLDSNSEFSPECITLGFIGFDPMTVRIYGRNLERLYDYIHQHRTPWIAEATHDFAADGQPIITKVEIARLELPG